MAPRVDRMNGNADTPGKLPSGDLLLVQPCPEFHAAHGDTFRDSRQPSSATKRNARTITESGIFAGMKARVAEFRNRKGKDWTQERLAAEMNLAVATIRKYERGEGLDCLRKVEQLAEVLGVHPFALLSEEGEALLKVKATGYDESILQDAIVEAIETAEQRDIRMSAAQIARLALVFYENRLESVADSSD